MAIDEKAPSELRPVTFHLGPQIPAGATLLSIQAYASLRAAGYSTTLAADAAAEAATITLADNPKAGALLTINPGSPTAEETVKVLSMAGNVATLAHTLEQAHSNGTTVSYEPGWNARLLVDETPTPVGTDVTLWVQNGADGKTYRLSVIGPLDDGQVIEEERDLVVTEHAPIRTITLQVDHIADVEFGYDNPVALAGNNLASAVAWISRETSVSTTLGAGVTAGDATVTLAANPSAGALLTLNPTGTKQEKLKVTSVSGTGPYVCTVHPTPDFDHSSGEPLTFEPGVSARLLASTTATIVGATKAVVRKRKGMANQTYRLTLLGTLATTGERIQGGAHLAIIEE